MLLQGSLYEVVTSAAGSATVRLLSECPIYKAHFPGFPITPGVTLLQIALELMGDKSISAAKDIKFMVPVLPTENGTILRYEWTPDGTVSLFLEDGTPCAKMVLTLA